MRSCDKNFAQLQGAGAVGSYVIWGLSLIQEVVEWN